jgi:preprotein translocase subunit SecE
MSVKHILWPQVRKLTISLGVILAVALVIVLVVAIVYEIPQALLNKALN